jgi:DNA-binding MarR family transcriptional regulator
MTARPAAPTRRPRAKPRTLTDADYRQLAEFRYVLRQFLAFSESAAHHAGLTPQHHQALLAIRGYAEKSRGLTVGELATLLGIRHHSAVGLVDRLAANGLVRRQDGTADRRRVLVALTAKADSLLASLTLAHRDELKRLAPLFRGLLRRL